MSKDKTPTQQMFDELVEKVMLYLREANCFGSPDEDGDLDEEVLEYYEGEVRAAIATVIHPDLDVVAVYTIGDVNERLDVVYGEWHWEKWDTSRRMEILNDVVHGHELNTAFEHLLDFSIAPE